MDDLLEPLFLDMKGILEDAALLLGCPDLELQPGQADAAAWAVSGAHLEISQGGKLKGRLGYLSGPILAAFKRNAQVAWLELELDDLPLLDYPTVEVKAAPTYPGSWLDFSLLWPTTLAYAALEQALDQFNDDLLQGRDLVATYSGKGLEPGMKSLSFRFLLGLADRTLTKEDIDGFKERFLAFLGRQGIGIR